MARMTAGLRMTEGEESKESGGYRRAIIEGGRK